MFISLLFIYLLCYMFLTLQPDMFVDFLLLLLLALYFSAYDGEPIASHPLVKCDVEGPLQFSLCCRVILHKEMK